MRVQEKTDVLCRMMEICTLVSVLLVYEIRDTFSLATWLVRYMFALAVISSASFYEQCLSRRHTINAKGSFEP